MFPTILWHGVRVPNVTNASILCVRSNTHNHVHISPPMSIYNIAMFSTYYLHSTRTNTFTHDKSLHLFFMHIHMYQYFIVSLCSSKYTYHSLYKYIFYDYYMLCLFETITQHQHIHPPWHATRVELLFWYSRRRSSSCSNNHRFACRWSWKRNQSSCVEIDSNHVAYAVRFGTAHTSVCYSYSIA